MCFSAQASFAAALVVGGVGAASVARAPTRAHLPFAAIPLIFAAQQTTEGALWLVLSRSPYLRSATSLGQLFLFFALFVWPSYLPLSLALVEPDRARRRLLVVAAVGGTVFGGYLLTCAVARPSYACVAFHHVYYSVAVDAAMKPLVPFVYLATVAAPLLVSSLRGTSLFACLTVSSFVAAGAIHRAGFASVWCFFAAVLSMAVYGMISRERSRGGASPATATPAA